MGMFAHTHNFIIIMPGLNEGGLQSKLLIIVNEAICILQVWCSL